MLRKYALPLALTYTVFLTVVSLITLKRIPRIGIGFDDKLYHVLAYIVLTVLWYFAAKEPKTRKTIIIIGVSCIVFGIVIEAVQGKVNVNRVADLLDVVANVIGVSIGLLYCFYKARRIS